jgi:hypothetical protein
VYFHPMVTMVTPDALTNEEKLAALNLVLQSDTFARADQLKNFLRYVCQMELAGRAGEITEYLIGVDALGRSEKFSPNDDSSVRNRAYALRHKLEKFYTDECPSAQVRIQFLKGTYIPRFVVESQSAQHPEQEAVLDDASSMPVPPFRDLPAKTCSVANNTVLLPARRFPVRFRIVCGFIGSLLAGVLIGSVATGQFGQRDHPDSARSPVMDQVIREAWGPLLGPHANVLLCVATAAQLTILPMDFKLEWSPPLPTFGAPSSLYPWYLRYHRLQPSGKLFLIPEVNSPQFGDVLGAMGIASIMAASGVPFQFLPERLVPSATLNERDVVLFGVPHNSEAVRKLLEPGRFEFNYDPGLRDIFLSEITPGNPVGRRFVPARDEGSERVESYGLITVLPSPGVGGGLSRTVIFSGEPSAGAAAAAEFFSSPDHMRDLKQRFAKEGYPHFPPSYQVVVRCRVDSNLPTSVSYETHIALP